MSAYCADPAFKKLEDKRNVNHIRLIRKLLLTGNIRACVYMYICNYVCIYIYIYMYIIIYIFIYIGYSNGFPLTSFPF